VTADVFVPEGITLTIQPGVTVKFNATKSLFVDGTLISRGTGAKPIAFTANSGSPSPGFWGSLSFSDTSTDATFDGNGKYTGGCILEHTTVQYGGSGNYAIKVNLASPYFNACTVQNNKGGMSIVGGTSRLNNCMVKNNSGFNDGGGLYVTSSSNITITNSTISSNSASNNVGGGLFASSSTVAITNSSFNGNQGFNGGGLFASSSTVTITNSTISGNSASGSGGGIEAQFCILTITNSSFTNNSTSSVNNGGGGGLDAFMSTVTITNSPFTGNSSKYGGGLYSVASNTVTIEDSIFTGNSAQIGAALSTGGSDTVYLRRNTFTGNTASAVKGGVLYLSGLSSNSIIGGSADDANYITNNPSDGVYISGNPHFNYNDISNNTGAFALVCGNSSSAVPIDATNNYWGTTNEAIIKVLIWDALDDASLGAVTYKPFLNESPNPQPTAGVIITQSGGSTDVTEGGATDTYTVVLQSQPTADVTVTATPDAQVSVSPTTLTFTSANWSVAQTVTVTAVDDVLVEGAHTGTISHSAASADPNYNGIPVANVTATITDNDTMSVDLSLNKEPPEYHKGDSMTVTAHLVNQGPARKVRYLQQLFLPSGEEFPPVRIDRKIFLASGTDVTRTTLNIRRLPAIPAGSYKWTAELRDQTTDELLARDEAPWQFVGEGGSLANLAQLKGDFEVPAAPALPKQTRLLANYPNPFNPETWLPYELASDATVTLHIYNVKGQLVRQLDLGYQKGGSYLDKERAAYWDGRDQTGNRVSSGLISINSRLAIFRRRAGWSL